MLSFLSILWSFRLVRIAMAVALVIPAVLSLQNFLNSMAVLVLPDPFSQVFVFFEVGYCISVVLNAFVAVWVYRFVIFLSKALL